eukprot:IDg23944t1
MSKWNLECDEAFSKLKDALCSAPILAALDWSRDFRCHTDASQFAVGGTLTQILDDGKEHAVAYFSKRLSEAEQNYTTNDRELLALVYFLQRFRCYLEGASFEVLTDNHILKNLFTKPNVSRREARWLHYLSQFNITKVTLKPGRIHVLGDVLSKIRDGPIISNIHALKVHLPENFIQNYSSDQTFGPLIDAMNGTRPSDQTHVARLKRLIDVFKLKNGMLYYGNKLCVPRSNIRDLLELAHDCRISEHFGFEKALDRLTGFHWKRKTKDIEDCCRGCITCQENKDGRTKPLGVPQPLEIPDKRWGSIATDFVNQFPVTETGFDAITTYVDRLTKRVHFVLSKTTDTAIDVAKSFYEHIFRHHGLPDSIVSDRDPKFTSKFWSELMSQCGVRLKMSSSYHAQTDGSSEIMNRMLENYLRCYCNYHQTDWDLLLVAAEFAYNSSKHAGLSATPFELDLGWKPKSPMDFLNNISQSVESVSAFQKRLMETTQDARFSLKLAQARQAAYNSKKYCPPNYKVGNNVWLSRGYNVHRIVHVEHTNPYYEHPSDIGCLRSKRIEPIIGAEDELEFTVDKIISHRKIRNRYQWLTLMKGEERHEATWQPTADFIDSDGTITKAFLDYIKKNNMQLKKRRGRRQWQ